MSAKKGKILSSITIRADGAGGVVVSYEGNCQNEPTETIIAIVQGYNRVLKQIWGDLPEKLERMGL